MSEEEKKAIEKFNNLYIKEFNGEPITTDDRLSYIEGALITNLIEKLEQELNSLKEIEQSHQEENGKLRVELEQEKEKHKNTGKLVKNKIDGTIGIVLREWETGQIQVLEKIQPTVINTHDSWKTLEVIEDE